MSKKIKCPNCGSKMLTIEYGLGAGEGKDVIWGGCIIEEENPPKYHCNKCNRSYYDNLKDYIEEDIIQEVEEEPFSYRKKKVEYDSERYTGNGLYFTKYDDLFRDIIRSRGIDYYRTNKVTKYKRDKNKIYATVRGGADYNVSIELLSDNKLNVKCECAYHTKDTYCKHIYAVLLTQKMVNERNHMKSVYKNNLNNIKEILYEIETLVNENKKEINPLQGEKLDHYKEYINDLINNYNSNDDIKLCNSVRNSYYKLNIIIGLYNKVYDYIEYYKDFKEREEYRRREEEKKKRKEDIKERKKQIKEKYRNNNKIDMGDILLYAFLDGLFFGNSKPHSKGNNYGYEPFNFEEENLEEDDFYYDDLD